MEIRKPRIKALPYEEFKDNESLEKIVDELHEGGVNVVMGSLDQMINWGRSNSLWSLTFATSCCGIEFMACGCARYDFSRFGFEVTRNSPRQADLIMCAGTITHKMAPALKRLYDEMAEPKYVVAVGGCAISGGPFKSSYHVVQGIEEIVPVDVFIPGCPPRPEAILYGMMQLQRKVKIEKFFGGSNMVPIIGNVVTTIACGTRFENVYGGSNKANIDGSVTLNINGGTITNVFGGSKGVMGNGSTISDIEANITGTVTLNLHGGTITNAFGGSNIKGNIGDLITVNVLDTSESCALHLTNIYGASNLASYIPTDSSIVSPLININHIKEGSYIAGNVYGGGKGAMSTVRTDAGHRGESSGDSIAMGMCVSNPQVNIGDDNEAHYVTIQGNVYGGGALSYVDGSTEINMKNANDTAIHTVVMGNLFGAGTVDQFVAVQCED